MAKTVADPAKAISRSELADLLNEDLAREYQAIIAYTVYSQVLKGAQYMSIAEQLQTHAQEELKHALIISRQVDYLGKMPTVMPKPVKTSEDAKAMLRFDLENENEPSPTLELAVRIGVLGIDGRSQVWQLVAGIAERIRFCLLRKQ